MSEIDEALKALRWELEVPDAPAVNPAAVTNRINALIRAHVKAILSARPPTPEAERPGNGVDCAKCGKELVGHSELRSGLCDGCRLGAERPAEKCHPWCPACRDAGCPDCSGSAPREPSSPALDAARESLAELAKIAGGRLTESDPSATSERTEDVRNRRTGEAGNCRADSDAACGVEADRNPDVATEPRARELEVARPTSGGVPDRPSAETIAWVRSAFEWLTEGVIRTQLPSQFSTGVEARKNRVSVKPDAAGPLRCDRMVQEGPRSYFCDFEPGHDGPCGCRVAPAEAASEGSDDIPLCVERGTVFICNLFEFPTDTEEGRLVASKLREAYGVGRKIGELSAAGTKGTK